MANTLEDLYLKYVDRVGKTMEDDRYFQYLYTMIQSGSNVLQQKHQILNKVVDERWISTIEDSLDAINNIIEKPRRFVTTAEEVVPVALAKKISADSVRHLSMNTQFIGQNDDGEIHPTKILNVTHEESYDLYENRFIYHLISRLIAFVDKRTDVIFWSTGNETSNTLAMESNVDDAYEQINYKIQMTIKNTQSLVENDNDNMQVFMRIDRVRRLTFALRSSSFYSLMAGCAKVHSPIQRTNLMMKDPNYRTCYKLWQFIESYDEVGYTIEPLESNLQFDEEYMIQMYTNMIANYTVFKSILETDDRDLVELEKKEYEPIKPKFVKEVQEQYVDNRDIPDVEVRRVFVEEVTQAQLDAEAKVQELTQKCEELTHQLQESEESEADAQRQIQGLYNQISAAMDQQISTEDELEKTIQEKEQLQENLENKIREQNELHEFEIEQLKKTQETTYNGQIQAMKNEYEEQLQTMQSEHENELQTMQSEHETLIQTMQSGYETRLQTMQAEHEALQQSMKDEYEQRLQEMSQQMETRISDIQKAQEEKLIHLKKEYTESLENLTHKYKNELSHLEQNNKSEISGLNRKHGEVLNETEQKYTMQLSALKQENEQKLSKNQSKYETQITQMRDAYELQITQMNEKYELQITQMENTYETQITQMKESHESQIDSLCRRYETETSQEIQRITDEYQTSYEALVAEKEKAQLANQEAQTLRAQAEKARMKAEEKAEGTRLSKYIIARLSGQGKSHEVTVEPEEEKDDDGNKS